MEYNGFDFVRYKENTEETLADKLIRFSHQSLMTVDKEVSVKNQSNSQKLGIDSEAGVS